MYAPIVPPKGRVVHRGKKLEVRLVQLEANGETLEKEIVVHPGAAVVLPFLSDQRMVLIRNKRLAVGRELWELPAGTLKSGEDPEACAIRELQEETGYKACRIENLGEIFTAGGWSTHRLFLFVARELSPGEQHLEQDEEIHVELPTFPEVRRMIAMGEIVDAKTIASLAIYCARYGVLETGHT